MPYDSDQLAIYIIFSVLALVVSFYINYLIARRMEFVADNKGYQPEEVPKRNQCVAASLPCLKRKSTG